MTDIELVIKIPEEMYKWVNDVNKFYIEYGISDFMDLIKNGTSLPKGHGRLIDADTYRKEMLNSREFDFFSRLDMQPTIIEADKEE